MTNIKVINGTLSTLNTFESEYYLSDAPVWSNLHLSLTDIWLYLTNYSNIIKFTMIFLCFLSIIKYAFLDACFYHISVIINSNSHDERLQDRVEHYLFNYQKDYLANNTKYGITYSNKSNYFIINKFKLIEEHLDNMAGMDVKMLKYLQIADKNLHHTINIIKELASNIVIGELMYNMLQFISN